MRTSSLLKRLLCVDKVVIEGLEFEGNNLIAAVRPHKRQASRCSRCGRKCPKHDNGQGRRRWRSLDFGTTRVFLEAKAPRVRCPEHQVVVARVPWARPDSGFTHDFENQTAWLATNASQKVVSLLMRITWRSVGRILRRVVDAQRAGRDLLDGVKRIGIDETSYRRGHRYLTVVVCHDTGRLVWAHAGNSKATLKAFLDALGKQRCALITHVTCDGAEWIHETMAEGCPNAVICMDAFHVVTWVNNAVDEIRRDLWNEHRKAGDQELANTIKGARWALLKNPENPTTGQQVTLTDLERNNQPLYRAYLLEEQLRLLLEQPAQTAAGLLDQWLVWASNCALEPFVKVARTVARIRPQIDATLKHGLSHGITESVNAKIRLIQQRAFGFHQPEALIALTQLNLSGLCPPLPGRTTK